MPVADVAGALISPLAFTPHMPMYQPAGSASGSDLSNTLVVSQNEYGEWELYGNTGGFGAAVSLIGAKSSNYAPVKPEQQVKASLTIAEQVAQVRAALGLNVSELAQVLQVTRPTVYGWLKGIEPQPAAVTRLARVLRLAQSLEPLHLMRMDTLIRRPLAQSPFNGATLLELIATDQEVTTSHLRVLADLDRRESASRGDVKGQRQLRSVDEALGDSSSWANET